MQLTKLRTQKERKTFLQSSLPQMFDTQKMWDFNDPRAQRIHKSIFDNHIIMDLQPFTIVNKPGFIRDRAITHKQFQLGSDKYYR